jgi:hypothetical protein
MGKTSADRQVSLVVWAAWGLMLAQAYFFILHYGSPVPYMDEWAIVPTLSGNRPLTLDWLWAQHNEHRIPIARLLLLGIYHVTDFNLRAAMLFSATALGALAFCMIQTAKQVRGGPSYADAFFPLALLNGGHAFNFFMGWQIVFLVPVGLLGILLIVMARDGSMGFASLVAAGICVMLLPLSGGMGLAMVPAAVFWLTACSVVIWNSRRPRSGRDAATALALAAISAGVFGLYFLGFEKPAHTPAPPDMTSVIRGALGFLSTDLGRIFPKAWYLGAIVALVASAAAGWSLIRAWRQQSSQRPRILGLGLFLGGLGCLALAVGWGRAGFGPGASQANRYVSLSVLVLCAAYFACVIYGTTLLARAVPGALCLAAALMIWPNASEAASYGAKLHEFLEPFEVDLKAGVPHSILAERYTHPPNKIYPEESHLLSYLGMLHDAGFGMFGQLREDPPHETVMLRDRDVQKPDEHVFVLKEPRFVYAVRLKYQFQPQAPAAQFRFTWRTPAGVQRSREMMINQHPEEEKLIMWVNEPIERLGIYPDTKPYACTIWDIELLVPPGEAMIHHGSP